MNILSIPEDFSAEQVSLENKNILVTGAGDGIGRAAALAFAARGASVILLGRSIDKLEAVYDQIESHGYPQPALVPFDLVSTEYNDYLTVKNAVSEHIGQLDGILHNAGILGEHTTIANSKPDQWMKVMQINLNGTYMLTKALLPLLEGEHPASILLTSSGVGRKGRAYWGAYSVSKFATEGFCQILADELENSNIRVNCINPGATRTAMRAKAYPGEDPLQLPSPESLMRAYLYLISSASYRWNGETFNAQQAAHS